MNKKEEDELAQQLANHQIAQLRARNETHARGETEEWEPVLSDSQRAYYYDDRIYVLGFGERSSGKTVAALHKLIRHCYLYDDAFAVIVALTKSGATGGGVWDKLTTMAKFADGPLKGTSAGMLAMWFDGIELEYGDEYEDGAHNKFVDIRNMHGGISRIMLKSMPISSVIKDRIKGPEISFFLFEELTNTYDPDYFIKVIQQIGRRATVPSFAQQYTATCNPADEGEDHWVFKTFFIPKKTQTKAQHEKRFGVHHVKMSQNEWMPGKEAFIQSVLEEAALDPTSEDRLIHGKWVKRVIGKGMFEGFWLPEVHIRPLGKKTRGLGLMPFENEMLTWGNDPGLVNNARVLLQRSLINGKWRWRAIDEIININQRLTDDQLVKATLEKMWFWNRRLNCTFPYEWIADEQALTHWNPSGSYIYQQWFLISSRMIKAVDRYGKLTPIRMKAPPKGAGSVDERVKTIINKLANEELLISVNCPHVIEMFGMLKRQQDKFGNNELYKPMRTKHLHTFDAISYPIYYYDLLGRENKPQSSESNKKAVLIC